MRAESLNTEFAAPGSFVRGIDARVKIIFGAACLLMSAGSSAVSVPVFVGIVSGVLLGVSGVRPLHLAVRAAEPVFFACVIAAFQLFLVPGETLFGADVLGFGLNATREGLARGLYIIARVFGGVMVVLFVSMTTPVDRLLSAAAWLKAPKGLVEVAMFAYRYVFVLFEDAMTVYQAQRGRLGYSGVRRAASSLGTLTGAVFLRAFSQAEATGEAMSLRGYSGSYVPAFSEMRRPADLALLGGLTLATLTLFIWT